MPLGSIASRIGIDNRYRVHLKSDYLHSAVLNSLVAHYDLQLGAELLRWTERF